MTMTSSAFTRIDTRPEPIHFPRARPCSPDDMEIFRDWCDAA